MMKYINFVIKNSKSNFFFICESEFRIYKYFFYLFNAHGIFFLIFILHREKFCLKVHSKFVSIISTPNFLQHLNTRICIEAEKLFWIVFYVESKTKFCLSNYINYVIILTPCQWVAFFFLYIYPSTGKKNKIYIFS